MKWFRQFPAIAALAVVLVACSNTTTPQQPTETTPTPTPAPPTPPPAPNVTAPAADSPSDDQQLDTLRPMLTVRNATADQQGTRTYEFQVADNENFNVGPGSFLTIYAVVSSKTGIEEGGDGKTSFTPESDLQPATRYWWRARATQGSVTGAWSTASRFKSQVRGFNRAGELFDPLTNSQSVGQANDVTFQPGTGARLNNQSSNIKYVLAETVTDGEFSMVVTGVSPGNGGDKTKLMFQMRDDGSDPTSNAYRFSVEHRGRQYTDPGQIRMRIITGSQESDSDKLHAGMRDENRYFVRLRWGAGRVKLQIYEGTDDRGPNKLDYSYGYGGTYRPNPHAAFVGGPVGRNGPIDASIPGLVARNVYIGRGTRPPSLGSALR